MIAGADKMFSTGFGTMTWLLLMALGLVGVWLIVSEARSYSNFPGTQLESLPRPRPPAGAWQGKIPEFRRATSSGGITGRPIPGKKHVRLEPGLSRVCRPARGREMGHRPVAGSSRLLGPPPGRSDRLGARPHSLPATGCGRSCHRSPGSGPNWPGAGKEGKPDPGPRPRAWINPGPGPTSGSSGSRPLTRFLERRVMSMVELRLRPLCGKPSRQHRRKGGGDVMRAARLASGRRGSPWSWVAISTPGPVRAMFSTGSKASSGWPEPLRRVRSTTLLPAGEALEQPEAPGRRRARRARSGDRPDGQALRSRTGVSPGFGSEHP